MGSMANAELFLTSRLSGPVLRVTLPEVTYPCGVIVNIAEMAALLQSVSRRNQARRSAIRQSIENGSLLWKTLQLYRARDKDRNGHLTWSSGDISGLVMSVFIDAGLSPPSEEEIQK